MEYKNAYCKCGLEFKGPDCVDKLMEHLKENFDRNVHAFAKPGDEIEIPAPASPKIPVPDKNVFAKLRDKMKKAPEETQDIDPGQDDVPEQEPAPIPVPDLPEDNIVNRFSLVLEYGSGFEQDINMVRAIVNRIRKEGVKVRVFSQMDLESVEKLASIAMRESRNSLEFSDPQADDDY